MMPQKRCLEGSSYNRFYTCSSCNVKQDNMYLSSCGCFYCESCIKYSPENHATCFLNLDKEVVLYLEKQKPCKYQDQGCTSGAQFICKCIKDGFVCGSCLIELHVRRVDAPCLPVKIKNKSSLSGDCEDCKTFIAEYKVLDGNKKVCIDCKIKYKKLEKIIDGEFDWEKISKELEVTRNILKCKKKKINALLEYRKNIFKSEHAKFGEAIEKILADFTLYKQTYEHENQELVNRFDQINKIEKNIEIDGSISQVIKEAKKTPCNESSADDCDSNHSNHFTWRSPPASIDFNTIDYDNSNRRTNTDTSSCVALESQCSARQVPPSKTPASEASTSTSDHNTKKSSTFDHAIVSNSGSRIKKRRSKVKKFFADDKLLAKVKTEAFERKAAFDESIKESFNFLDQTIPTLKSSKPYQPILVHVSKLLHDLNSKMEENDKIKSISSGYMIEKKIEVKKTRDGNVKIGGRLILPSKIYGYIISRNEPNLIVSRTIRRLYDKNIRQGAELNEKADMSNFIFRIGDPELDGEERLSDGQKIVDIIIEHAHQVLGLDFVCFKEYRECMTQVGKAVYDANRPEGSKKRKVNTFDDNDEQASKRYRKINIETESEEDHVQSEPESARQKNRVNLELFI